MLWIILALGAAILHSAGTLINKNVMNHEHALEFGALKGTFGLLLFFALPFIDLNFSLGTYLSIFGVSIIITIGVLYHLKSTRHGDLSSIAPLLNLSPLFLLVIAFVLLGEQVSSLALAGVFLLVIGTYFLQIGASDSRNFLAPITSLYKSKYSSYMILVAILFSLSATLEKGLLNAGIPVLSLVVILRLMMNINFIAFDFIKYGKKQLFLDVKKDGKIAFLGSATDILSISLQYLALSIPGVMISLVIPIKRLSTLFTTLVGGRLFHEKHLRIKMISCVIMLVGIGFIAFF